MRVSEGLINPLMCKFLYPFTISCQEIAGAVALNRGMRKSRLGEIAGDWVESDWVGSDWVESD